MVRNKRCFVAIHNGDLDLPIADSTSSVKDIKASINESMAFPFTVQGTNHVV